MKVLSLPFTKKLCIQKSNIPGFVLQLRSESDNLNHIGTIHASASYALAETTSGQFLREQFSDLSDLTLPILRKSSSKYTQGVKGDLFSKAKFVGISKSKIREELKLKKKTQFSIEVKLYDQEKKLIMSSIFEWFVKMN